MKPRLKTLRRLAAARGLRLKKPRAATAAASPNFLTVLNYHFFNTILATKSIIFKKILRFK